MKPTSIRRALLIHGGIGVGSLLCLLFGAVYLLVRHSLYQELDASITQTATFLANQIEYEENAITYEWAENQDADQFVAAAGLFQYWDHRTGLITRSPALGSHDLPEFEGIEGQPLLRDIRLPNGHRGRAIGLRAYPFVVPEEKALMEAAGTFIDPKQMPQTLVVAGNTEPLHQTLKIVQRTLAAGVLLTLAFGFIIILRAIRMSLRPIDELSAEMEERAENQLDAPLDLTRALPSELIPLATNFDSVLSRVAAIRQREKDFIRHAAHELRTPVAGLRTNTDLALSKPRNISEYVSHLTICRDTAIELGELVARLSALARVSNSNLKVALASLDAKEVLSECLERFESRWSYHGLRLKLELPVDKLLVNGDAALLRIIFNNLLDNAASYAKPETEIHISGACNASRAEIRIVNMTEDAIEDPDRLFEPLFRKETSRSDASSHLGIGLSLAQSAAASMSARLNAKMIGTGQIEFVLTMATASSKQTS